ncbi:MAG: hypothetical protein MNPFHGCM_00240 [Gemmatimonadaceae bacterium]|nr:hypothetical protein [Gemmatimonadaceae bacterium]
MSTAAGYHDLLTAEIAEGTHDHLERHLAANGLVFGGRALCTVLRPRFLTLAQYRSLQQRLRPLMRAFDKAYERAMADPVFRGQFKLVDWEETLLADRTGYSRPSPTSRLDFFWDPARGALGLTEYNAETPAGAAYTDALSDAFLDAPAMRQFSRTHDVMPIPARHGVVGVLLDAYREFRGGGSPTVGILDWDDVPTVTEFEMYRRHFASLGIACVIDDPRRCEYRGGVLHAGGRAIDLVYKRVLISELIDTCGLDSPVVRAVRDGAVCMVDGFRCKILHKKASLAVLSDDANADMFDAEERRGIGDCIPWTRVVEERKTAHDGQTVDLIPHIVEHRERFVIKPNDEYGGKGIVLGWTVSHGEWEAAVQEAMKTPHIVQDKVVVPSEPYPSWVDGRVEIYDRMYDTAPFVCHGEYMEGVLTRLSTADLLNVTAGGGSTVPTFIAERR